MHKHNWGLIGCAIGAWIFTFLWVHYENNLTPIDIPKPTPTLEKFRSWSDSTSFPLNSGITINNNVTITNTSPPERAAHWRSAPILKKLKQRSKPTPCYC